MSERTPAPPPAVTGPLYVYAAETLAVHDGDTYTLRVDLGFKIAVTIQCRLRGANSPELRTPEGKAARDYAYALLIDHGVPFPLLVASYRDARSFERWVCDVWLPSGKLLADLLIEAGHAVPLDHW